MEISGFQWDEDNVAHIARHHVYPDEVEELAFDDEPWIRKGSGGTRYMLGYTISGRYLFVVYALKEKGIASVVRLTLLYIWRFLPGSAPLAHSKRRAVVFGCELQCIAQ